AEYMLDALVDQGLDENFRSSDLFCHVRLIRRIPRPLVFICLLPHHPGVSRTKLLVFTALVKAAFRNFRLFQRHRSCDGEDRELKTTPWPTQRG
ncbi:MAG: hypothetical protein ACREX9_01395, partial [Gammaproteobacteria bacterium]